MALTVNSNIQAMNAYRNLNKTQASLSSSLEKLSSGLRINRAADDAAGLAISEGFKAQIGGIQQASKNAQDGVSLVQTADGALSETQTILQRLRTLAVSSANGSQSSTSRTAINSEASALKAELTRIAQTSNFNGVNLLDGTLKTSANFQIGYRADNTAAGITGNVISVAVDSGAGATTILAASATQAALVNGASATASGTDYDFSQAATHAAVAGTTASVTGTDFAFGSSSTAFSTTIVFDGATYNLAVTGDVTGVTQLAASLNVLAAASIGTNKLLFSAVAGKLTITGGASANLGASDTINVTAINVGVGAATSNYGFTIGAATGTAARTFSTVVAVDGATQTLTVTGNVTSQANLALSLTAAAAAAFGANKVTFATTTSGLISVSAGSADSTLVGASSTVSIVSITQGFGNSVALYGFTVGSATGAATVSAFTNKAGSFDVVGLGLSSLDLSNQASATAAITSIDTAITNVSNARANLGALQNRFQYTVDNLDTTSENLSSAESRVVDTDMASEMVNYTRASILSQAGTSMLSQAKNLPQSILDLLKS